MCYDISQFGSFTPVLPTKLTSLSLRLFNLPIYTLPPNLTHLVTDDEFNLPVHNLPSTITHLTFGSAFNQPVNELPPNLIYFKIRGESFDQPINNLPSTLIYFFTGNAFNQLVNQLNPSYHWKDIQQTSCCTSYKTYSPDPWT
jgi:FNIP Repeat